MKIMTRLAGAALLALAATAAFADTVIYTPTRSLGDQGITLKGWGSGTASEADEMAFEGTSSIRFSSRNYFQGGTVVYASPVSVVEETKDPNNLLVLKLQVPDASTTLGGGNSGPNTSGGDDPGQSNDGGGGAAAGGGARGGGQGQQDGLAIKMLRVVIATSDGKKSECFLEVNPSMVATEDWLNVSIPLQSIAGFQASNKMISSISFASDATASFYVGDARVLNDTTPIYGEPNVREYNLANGDEIVLAGSGYGGATPLRYTWDFDAADGVAVDAEGQAIRRRFRLPGEYTITFTVSDKFGKKKSHSSTIKVVVNP